MANKMFGWLFKKEEINTNEGVVAEPVEVQEEPSDDELMKKRIANFGLGETELLGIERNKLGKEMYIVKCTSGENIDIYLFNKENLHDNLLPFIHTYFKMDDDLGKKILFIDDVQAVEKRSRNGEILMDHLLDIAKKIDVPYVSGGLAYTDKDRFDTLERFYDVTGFEVDFNDARTGGSIKQEVKDIDKNREERDERKAKWKELDKAKEKPVRSMMDMER